jgi:hypothetical protein
LLYGGIYFVGFWLGAGKSGWLILLLVIGIIFVFFAHLIKRFALKY